MFSVFINEREKKTVKGPPKPMAVLLPTPHQEKEHQEKSRRGYEKPRVEPGPMGVASPVQYVLRVTERKGSFLPEKEPEEMGGGRGKG